MDTDPLLERSPDGSRPTLFSFIDSSEFQTLHPTLRRFELAHGKIVYNGYLSEGSRGGPLLCCLHGFGANALSFEALFAHLQRGSAAPKMVALDTYGFGYSQTQTPATARDDAFFDELSLYKSGSFGAVAVVKQVLRLLAEPAPLALSIVVMGHSMGSITAMSAACALLEQGHAVKAVVLVAPAILSGPSSRNPARMNDFHKATSFSIRVIFSLVYCLCLVPCRALSRAALKMLLWGAVSLPFFWSWGLHVAFGFKPQHPTARTVKQYSVAAKKDGWTDRLTDFVEGHIWRDPAQPSSSAASMHDQFCSLLAHKVKVLIIHSDDDPLVSVDNSQSLFDQFKQSRGAEGLALERMQGKGHMPMETDLDEFVALLRKHDVVGLT